MNKNSHNNNNVKKRNKPIENNKVPNNNLKIKPRQRKPIQFDNLPSFIPHKTWTRTVIIIAVCTIIYFTALNKYERKFASQKETILYRSQNLQCSNSYLKEMEQFPNCVPRNCGRFVMDSLLNTEEINNLLTLAKTGLSFGGSDGGASILDLYSGALSKGTQFINIYKLYEGENIFSTETLNTYKMVTKKISHAISDKFGIEESSIYLTYPTFFSRITNETAKTIHDEYWHPHVDKETYNSFHYTSLVYLTDFSKDFNGGRFMFIDDQGNNKTFTSTIEPKKGRVSAFSSGAENLHYVEKVTSGTRYALTISFTCDKTFAISEAKHLNYD